MLYNIMIGVNSSDEHFLVVDPPWRNACVLWITWASNS